MSAVILGGNECMERRYKELCEKYSFRTKIFTKPVTDLKRKIGTPDLLIFFTNTVSHKMIYTAERELKGSETTIIKSHTSSISALKNILDSFK